MPFDRHIAEAPVGEHIRVVGIVDPAAAPEHPLRCGPDVELGPTALGAHRPALHAEVLPDTAAAQSREGLARERFADDFRDADLETRVHGQGARCEDAVARERVHPLDPPEVSADRDLARIIGGAPTQAHAPLELRARGSFGRIRLRQERRLGGARRGREHGGLEREPQCVSRLHREAHLRNP